MPPEIYAALEKLAGKKRHTVPSYIRWLIWKHIDETDMQISLFSKGGGVTAGPEFSGRRRFCKIKRSAVKPKRLRV